MFKKKRVHPNIILDWFNVSYRSVLLSITAVVLVAAAVVFAYYYFREGSPKAEARFEINQAELLYNKAAEFIVNNKNDKVESKLQELKGSSRSNLDQAIMEYERKNYTDSKVSAIRSQNLSQKAIDIATGKFNVSANVRFYKIEGEVKIRRAGSFVWESASPNKVLGYGDQVKTSSNSSAQVIYFDGTMTTVSPGSLLEIREISEDPRTKITKVQDRLNWGSLLVSTQKQKVKGSYHEISTETSSARSEQEASFKIAHDQSSGESSFDLFAGSLAIASNSEKTILNSGERVKVAKGGSISEKEGMPPAPRLVSPPEQKIFVYTNPTDVSTALVWEKSPGKVTYHLHIANQPLFSTLVLDKKDIKSSYVEIASLPEGNYYWRVACVNDRGIEGVFSEVRKFKITSSLLRDKSDMTPPKIEIKDTTQTGPLVIINGRTEPGATLWVDSETVDVYDDGTFYAVVRLKKEGVNQITLTAQDSSGNENKITRKAFLEDF